VGRECAWQVTSLSLRAFERVMRVRGIFDARVEPNGIECDA